MADNDHWVPQQFVALAFTLRTLLPMLNASQFEHPSSQSDTLFTMLVKWATIETV